MFAAMKSIAYTLIFVSTLASALPWEGPEPTASTSNSLKDMGFSPKPSSAPAALFAAYELKRRQASITSVSAGSSLSDFIHATCGFLTGDPDNPLTCVNSGYKCAIDTARTVFGCCSDLDSCTIRTSCLPQASLSACDTDCQQDPFIAKCAPASPFCNQNLLVAAGTPTLTNWYCDDSPTIVTQFAIPTGTESGKSGSYALVTLALLTHSSSTSSATSSSIDPTTTKAVIYVTVSPTPTPTAQPKKKSTPIGAIVGGVVGGIALIIAAIVAFICLRRSKDKKRKQDVVGGGIGAATGPVEVPAGNAGPFYGPVPGQTKEPGVGGFYQPAIAEKEGTAVGVGGQQKVVSELYSPPHSPAPQYTPPANSAGHQPSHALPQQAGSPHVYPNMAEMGSSEISSQAKPGTY